MYFNSSSSESLLKTFEDIKDEFEYKKLSIMIL